MYSFHHISTSLGVHYVIWYLVGKINVLYLTFPPKPNMSHTNFVTFLCSKTCFKVWGPFLALFCLH